MTLSRVAIESARFYWRTHLAVALGVAAAVAVLSGSLLVGSSVKSSLASIAAGRVGRSDFVIFATTPFTDVLGTRLGSQPHAPILSLSGVVNHRRSGRRTASVLIYGVDPQFFAFHGVSAAAPEGSNALLSPDLSAELDPAVGDDLIVRVARPTDIPIDALHGRRDDTGRSIRFEYHGTLDRESMGEFSLAPGQGPVRAIFVALDRLQRDLSLPNRVNTLLLGAGPHQELTAPNLRKALRDGVSATDLGLKFETIEQSGTVIVESASGLVSDAEAKRTEEVAAGRNLSAAHVLTWLATKISSGGRTVPYSIVSAVSADGAGDRELAALLAPAAPGAPTIGPAVAPPIVLTEWAARDLGVNAGDPIDLEYYRWADEGRLVTERAAFRIAGVLPMRGVAVDRRLAPDYPGISTSSSFADWDPPFPIDLKLVRPADENYWREYRTAPKAFLPLAVGQRLWRTRYGQLTSIRLRGEGLTTGSTPDLVREAIVRRIDPLATGFTLVDIRAQSRAASAGATDFGAYFSYFSFFLMVSALLLSALFFRLSVEQRLSQIGVLRATGLSLGAVRRLFLVEGALVIAAGAVLGVLLAIGWAALMMFGLRTWWRGAVGTTLLSLHVDWRALAAGALGAAAAALVSIVLTIRGLGRRSPRALISGARDDAADAYGQTTGGWLAIASFAGAVLLSIASLAGAMAPAGGFFGAGSLVLVAGLAACRVWLRKRRRVSFYENRKKTPDVFSLAFLNAAWRPGRSLTAAGLVAAAVFLLVSVDAFRKRADSDGSRASGTGGFALIGESALPIVDDLTTAEGQRAAGLDTAPGADALTGTQILGLRLRPGDDTSCLNLYQPSRPRVVGVPDRFTQLAPFRFAKSLATSDADRQNPWRLLGPADADGIVPAIADQTSLEYVLHSSVGKVITIDADTARPVRLRIVASLDDSVLQGEILIGLPAFETLFPDVAGARVFFVSITPTDDEHRNAVALLLEEALDPYGLDVDTPVRRLAAYHRVENTYLSTFQALGGLGLVLGIVGLVAILARNVLERRRELALLRASGFTPRDLQKMVLVEHLALVAAGLVIGLAAAFVAIAPVLAHRSGALPMQALIWIVPVAGVGLLATMAATRSVRRLPLVASLRSE